MLSLLWFQVQSLVRELIAHKLHSVAKKKKREREREREKKLRLKTIQA